MRPADRLRPGLVRGVVGLILCGALAGCGGGGQTADRSARANGGVPAGSVPAPLRTVRAERRSFARTVPWFGRVESRRSVTVIALDAGRIVAVEAADGSEVRQGEPLFRLGGPAATRRRQTLETKVDALEDRVQTAGETVALRRDALAEQLVRRDELLAAEGELARLHEELAAAHQDLDALGSALDLRSPAAGTFTGRRVAVGQDVAAGEALAEIVDTGSLRVVASLYPPPDPPAGAGPGSRSGHPGTGLAGAPVTFDGREGEGGARIARVLPDRSPTGATTVWIEGGALDAGPAAGWGPGEAVSGKVRSAVHDGAVAVPEAAVVRDERDRPFVFVPAPGAGPPGRESGYRKQPVTTGLSADGWVELTSGLDAGAEVVSEGAYELLFRDFGATYTVPD